MAASAKQLRRKSSLSRQDRELQPPRVMGLPAARQGRRHEVRSHAISAAPGSVLELGRARGRRCEQRALRALTPALRAIGVEGSGSAGGRGRPG